MKQAYRRWVCGLLGGVLLILLACGAVVYAVDPCLYYRMPQTWEPVFFNERWQAAGIVKHVEADTVLLGTSMTANYRGSEIGEIFGGTAVRVTVPDGRYGEFDAVTETLFRHQSPERVIFALDLNTLGRNEDGADSAMPMYLYNESRLDDVRYLLNKDALYYSAYVLLSQRWGGGEPLDESFVWETGIWWNHMTALEGYERPAQSAETADPAEACRRAAENLAVMGRWFREHPDTQFEVFLSPYSMLFWDKSARLGQTEAMLAVLELACEELTGYDNVRLHGCLMDREIVDDLDYYCDHLHHSREACRLVLEKIAGEEVLLTKENVAETLANWRTFVVNYDYEKFWDEAFWMAWNAAKAAQSAS